MIENHKFSEEILEVYLADSEFPLVGPVAGALSSLSCIRDIFDVQYIEMSCMIIRAARERNKIDSLIKFCIVQNDNFATADARRLDDGTYLITLYSGLCNMCIEFAAAACRSEPLAEFFGNGCRILFTHENYRNVDCFSEHAKLPKFSDEENQSISAYALGMVTLCVCHELTHILNGHLKYIEDKVITNPTSESDINIREVLEYDADAGAISEWMKYFLSGNKINDLMAKYLDTEELAYSYITIICGLTFSFQDNRSVSADWKIPQFVHSPAIVRMYNLIATLNTILLTKLNKTDEYVEINIVPVMKAVFTFSWMLKGLKDPALSPNGQRWYPDYLKYVDRIQRGWADIRDDLQKIKVSKVGNLAPVIIDRPR